MGTCVCALASCGGMLRPAINFSCSSCLGDLQHFTGQTSCQSRVEVSSKACAFEFEFKAVVRVHSKGYSFKTGSGL